MGPVKKAFQGLGIAGAGNPNRHPEDFYGSADEGPAATALVRWLLPKLRPETNFWDPACGSGNIVRAMWDRRPCSATDLYDRGWDGAATGIDFLQTKPGAARNTAIISNPPFKLAREFVETAHRAEAEAVAFLLKSTYFQAGRRADLFWTHRPRYILPLTWRIDFTGQGAPVMECSWFVWLAREAGSGQVCEYVLLEKPT